MEQFDNKYYDNDEFKESNDLFESFLSKCTFKNISLPKQDPLSHCEPINQYGYAKYLLHLPM